MNAIYTLGMAAAVFVAAGTAAAQNLTITVQAQKQGAFKGEIAMRDETIKAGGRTELLDLRYEMDSPRDAATGLASGKRIYKPLTIVKRFGASSPQYLQALSTNEVLPQVLIEGFSTNRNGELRTAFTIRLTNATVSHVDSRLVPPSSATGKAAAATADDLHEVIQFTYQKIEVTSETGKTMFSDSWRLGP